MKWHEIRQMRTMEMVKQDRVCVGKTMPFLPAMTGNGNHTTHKIGDDWGMVYHYNWFINPIN